MTKWSRICGECCWFVWQNVLRTTKFVSLNRCFVKFFTSTNEHDAGRQIPFLNINISSSNTKLSLNCSSKPSTRIDEYVTMQCWPWISEEFSFRLKFMQSVNWPKFIKFSDVNFMVNCVHDWNTKNLNFHPWI